jgi:EAL domain-containing protein (putative c-di-GMP-specific phosphodiesterase class I)
MVDLQDGSILGMEALLRWQHPRLGLLLPAAFLPAAQEAGLSTEIDLWVLAHACGQACRWSRGRRLVPVTVNVSAQRFRDAPLTLSSDVALVLERTTLPPELLILEINEHTVIDDPDLVARELHELRKLGVGLALDDFGAGRTSLTHLRRLPIGMLKIDHDLIRGVGDDADGADDADDAEGSHDTDGSHDHDTAGMRILTAVTTLAHILGMTVVAEGVERAEQVLALRQAACDAGQGFHFSPPVDAEAADSFITATACTPNLLC